jgi:REP element-mobilizing transposase RayT
MKEAGQRHGSGARVRWSEAAREAGIAVWAWCLMPNHVHLVLAPEGEDGLRHALALAHRSYAGMVHAWQGRFGAAAMDEPHLTAAFRYVTLLWRSSTEYPVTSVRHSNFRRCSMRKQAAGGAL